MSFDLRLCDPAGTRTQDHYIKSVMLYQLSYGIEKSGAKVRFLWINANQFLKKLHIEPEMHAITVFYNIFFAFNTQFSSLFYGSFSAVF